jgi:hypothetical protein
MRDNTKRDRMAADVEIKVPLLLSYFPLSLTSPLGDIIAAKEHLLRSH